MIKLGGIPSAPVLIPDGSLSQTLATLEGRSGNADSTPDQRPRDRGSRRTIQNRAQGPSNLRRTNRIEAPIEPFRR